MPRDSRVAATGAVIAARLASRASRLIGLRVVWRVLALAILLVAWMAVGPNGMRPMGRVGPLGTVQAWFDARLGLRATISVADYASCDGEHVADAGLERVLALAAGGRVLVPTGCRLLLDRPSGDVALTVSAGTRIECEHPAAGFVVARRACAGDTTTPGAACATAAECAGSAPRCVVGGNATAPFAVDADRLVTVLRASGPGVQIVGCRIDVGQADPYGRCQVTNGPGRACSVDVQCDRGAACASGDGRPAGPGRINVIDATGQSDVRVERVAVVDHTDGVLTLSAGPRATVVELMNDSVAAWDNVPRGAAETAVVVNGTSLVRGCRLRAARRVIDARGVGGGVITANEVTVAPRVPSSREIGVGVFAGNSPDAVSDNLIVCERHRASQKAAAYGTGVVIAEPHANVHNNFIVACFHGIEVAPVVGNVTIEGNRLFGGVGAKLVLQAFGTTVTGNYLAWGTGDQTSDPPGRTCRGGLHGGAICLDDGACAGGWCAAEPIIWVGSEGGLATDHVSIGPGNLIYAGGDGIDGIRLAELGHRCFQGTVPGKRCTSDAECAGGACYHPIHRNVMISGNQFLNAKAGAAALDLSLLPGGDTTIDGVMFSGNHLGDLGDAFPIGVRMPAQADRATHVAIVGNAGFIGTLVAGWTAANGRIEGNAVHGPSAPRPAPTPRPGVGAAR